jgi:hypothetical protein
MPAKKRRTRNIDFDEYIPTPPQAAHVEQPTTAQERHTHYEVHGRAVHSTLSIPASPPTAHSNNLVTDIDDYIEMSVPDDYMDSFTIQEIDEDREDDNCALEAQGLGSILEDPIFLQDSGAMRQKCRRTQAVSKCFMVMTSIP